VELWKMEAMSRLDLDERLLFLRGFGRARSVSESASEGQVMIISGKEFMENVLSVGEDIVLLDGVLLMLLVLMSDGESGEEVGVCQMMDRTSRESQNVRGGKSGGCADG